MFKLKPYICKLTSQDYCLFYFSAYFGSSKLAYPLDVCFENVIISFWLVQAKIHMFTMGTFGKPQ